MANLLDTPWLLPTLGVAILVLAALAFRRFRASRTGLQAVLNDIAFERLDGIVLPNGDDGVIQIDHLLLTAQGILVLHVKEVKGTIFGADKMQDWTVMAPERRFTFANPQPALFDRVAAVRQVVRDVPVEGRILFLDGAEFTKGVPDLVRLPDELRNEFGEVDKAAAKRKVEAFIPHWQRLGQFAVSG